MEIVKIDLSKINFTDKSYYIPFKVIPSDLKSSIKSIGVINPPLLLSKSNDLTVITGWKRISISKEQNEGYVLCKLYNQNELSFEDIISTIYEDNKQRYTDVEIGLLANIYLEHNRNLRNYLELTGIPRTDKNLEKYNYLSKVDYKIIDYYLDEKLSSEQVFLLSQLYVSDALFIANSVIIPYRFNNNESREFVRDISEISNRDNISIDKIIDNLLNLNDKISKDKIRYYLKKRRYPNLVKIEEQFDDYLKDLKLPKYINISHSPFFENNFIDLVMRLDNENKLKETRELFAEEYTYTILSDLIRIVREGKKDI